MEMFNESEFNAHMKRDHYQSPLSEHIKEIIHKAPFFLKEKGWLILENHYDQGEKVKQLFIENRFTLVEIVNDFSGIGRFTIGRYK